MKKKAPAFQFYPKDYLADAKVCAMTYEEQGMYWRLCCHCWLEGWIPDDPESVARILGVPCDRFSGCWERIRACFRKARGGSKLTHPRLDLEKNAQKRRSQQRREAGLLGAEKRYGRKDLDSKATVSNKQTGSSSSSSASATPNKKQPTVAGPNGPSPAREEPARVVFEHWNRLSALKRHGEFTDKMRKSVKARLKARPLADLLRAVTRYAELVQAGTAPGWCKWGLGELMSRGEGTAIDDMLNPDYHGIESRSPPTIGERNREAARKFVEGDFT